MQLLLIGLDILLKKKKKDVPVGVSLCTWYNKLLEVAMEYFCFAYPSYNANGCGFKYVKTLFYYTI